MLTFHNDFCLPVDVRRDVLSQSKTLEVVVKASPARSGGQNEASPHDISWDLTEGLADIDMPDDLDSNIDDIVPDPADLSGTISSFDVDDFFSNKTPEMPKWRKQTEVEMGQGDGERLGLDFSGVWTQEEPGLEDESPLIAFTP